jgi:hypothetical protein
MKVTQSASSVDPDAAGTAESPGGLRLRRPPRPGGVRRGVLDRITLSTVIGVVAALLVFVLTAVLLRDRREMVSVAVASERIPAGTTITPAVVRRAEVPASVSFVDSLVRFGEVGPSSVAARTVQPGEALSRSALGSRESSSAARVMAIPVESWQAVGGEVDVGDQVDVIDTGDAGPRYVLSGAGVVGRAGQDSGGGLVASGSGKLWIDVEVTATEALVLAGVIESGDFVLVRSTGADEETVATSLEPAATATPSTSPTPVPAAAGGG